MFATLGEVHEACREMGAAENKAFKAAAVLGRRDDDLAKAVTDIRLDIAVVKGEQIVHRWMLGFLLATNVAVVLKLFSH